MSLIDHTHKDRTIDPTWLENIDLIKKLREKLHARSYEKLLAIVDAAVESVAQNGGKLTLPWACAGSLFGHGSSQPHNDVEYVWDKVIEIVGSDRFCKMAVGALLQWRIALRAEEKNEPWHAYKTEYDEIDPDTGKKITRYEYWLK